MTLSDPPPPPPPPTPLWLPPTDRFASLIDLTLLRPEATKAQIDRLCDDALEHQFCAVCVNGAWVERCVSRLGQSGVAVAAVAGFPLGAAPSGAKAFEARALIDAGAAEIDMVAAVGHMLDGDWEYVDDDLRAVVSAAGASTVKVILETAVLDDIGIMRASGLASAVGAGFVKTSTGFHPAGGASPDAVTLMREAVGQGIGVKAAGGVRDCATALRMIAAGASRLGTSAGVAIVECLRSDPTPWRQLLADPDRHRGRCKCVDR